MTERLGAVPLGEGRTLFRVWAPAVDKVEVRIFGRHDRTAVMEPGARGYHQVSVDDVEPGARYLFRLGDGVERPDPASRFQPDGVHGPSVVVDPDAFPWSAIPWVGLPLQDYVIYELHVGTFTPQGTFDAAIEHLRDLVHLGVTAVEVMPVAQFPGDRNWGYDGVFPFAVQNSYGGPDGLKRFVDECHALGLAVVLDVVYNHLGPEGAHLADFGPYFTDRYTTPWGPALNVDGPGSDEVRAYFLANARMWFEEFRVDALRLDAVHGIVDMSAVPFLRRLAEQTEELSVRLNRRLSLIAESDRNDPQTVRAPEVGGLGIDAQWADDFHHAVHTLLTGERDGYYMDYGSTVHLVRALTNGFVYDGAYSRYRERSVGAPPRGVPAHRFVVCVQNHDQVGNRARGERLSSLVPFEALKLAAGVLLLSPFTPLLFMGEEYGEPAPFQYFVSHTDPALVEAVRTGRREEFAAFAWADDVPDPQDPETFARSTLDHSLRRTGKHAALRELYRELLRLRREVSALRRASTEQLEASADERSVALLRWDGTSEAFAVFNFDPGDEVVEQLDPSAGAWRKALDSADDSWGGPGGSLPDVVEPGAAIAVAPHSFVCLTRERREEP